MLEITGLRKVFGKYYALDGLSMNVPKGAIYGCVGQNGAGKTTTIKCIVGLLRADEGSIELDGEDILKHPGKQQSRIGYVPDEFGVYDNLKVGEYLEFFASCYGMEGLKARKRYVTLLEQVGLGDKLGFYVDGLSRGMKQRLSLARAMIHDPELLIMDEPMSGLDPATRMEFRQTMADLAEQGKTILISSHVLPDLAEMCTYIGIMEQGRMTLEGSVSDIIADIYERKPIVITVFGSVEPAIDYLKQCPKAETITVKGNEIMIGFSGDEKDEAWLLRELLEAGIQVRGFVREAVSLESAFMHLTNHQEKKVVLSYESESGL